MERCTQDCSLLIGTSKGMVVHFPTDDKVPAQASTTPSDPPPVIYSARHQTWDAFRMLVASDPADLILNGLSMH